MNFDDLFKNLHIRVTADAPTMNYLTRLENEAELKQAIKEFFCALGDKHITSAKDRTKWRRKVAEL